MTRAAWSDSSARYKPYTSEVDFDARGRTKFAAARHRTIPSQSVGRSCLLGPVGSRGWSSFDHFAADRELRRPRVPTGDDGRRNAGAGGRRHRDVGNTTIDNS